MAELHIPSASDDFRNTPPASGGDLGGVLGPPRSLDRGVADRAALGEMLRTAPSLERSGLEPELYRQLLAEVRQHTDACLQRPRITHTNLINKLVQKELDEYQAHAGVEGWRLREVSDEYRAGSNRRYIFGQVDAKGGSRFFGCWMMERGGTDTPICFKITADATILSTDRSTIPTVEERKALDERGPSPWKLQVAHDSVMGQWISNLYGSRTSGFFTELSSLGVFTEALQRGCAKEGLSHMLLPRSRRNPGNEPWHVGNFLTFNGEYFLWSDWAMDKTGIPVRPTVMIRPHCLIVKADLHADQKGLTT